MIAVGVDLVDVARIAGVLERHGARFLDRVFTPKEQELCASDPRRLAGRYAVKEAVAKALGTGIGHLRWTDIEVLNDPRGKPRLLLHESASALAKTQGWQDWDVSLSHTESQAIGFAVATRVVSER
jgi:holo-[acyl-carrier protein] synthase